jgi:uncharacterized membrane-anchored protein
LEFKTACSPRFNRLTRRFILVITLSRLAKADLARVLLPWVWLRIEKMNEDRYDMKLCKNLAKAPAQICLATVLLLSATGLPAAPAAPAAEENEFKLASINWLKGPATASMKSIAEIDVPKGFMFTDGPNTRRLMEAMGNLTSGSEIGFLAPTSMVWFVIFRFSEDGYVKDDEKDKLDADKMLKTIKSGTEESNRERKRRGWSTMTVVGWEQKPVYDPVTHNLEWAVRGESEGEQVVNYNTRLLGRKGVMEVKLVVQPDKLQDSLPKFKELLTAYTYKPGERYAEYHQGDKLAKYGLAALITGGAVAVAAKTGLLAYILVFAKKLWKLVVVAVVAIGAFFKRLITGRSATKTLE